MSFLPIFEKTLYKNQSGKVGFWTIKAFATGASANHHAQLMITHAKTLDGKSTPSFVPVLGMNIGKSNETTPQDQAILEAESRIRKQFDRGYVETPELATQPVTNALGKKKPQLAVDVDKVKEDAIDWDNAWLQPKFDGHRCMNDGFIYSRNGKSLDVAHVSAEIARLGLTDFKMDGELYVHGMHLNKIGSLIKKPQEESLQLSYYVYDLVDDAPFEDRYAALTDKLAQFDVEFLVLAPTYRVRSMAEARAKTAEFVANGYEGGILRWGREGYEDDKRSKYLIKLKDFTDLEVTVTGFSLGTPQIIDGMKLEQPILHYITTDGKEGKVLAHGNAHEKHAIFLQLSTMTDISLPLTIEHFGLTSKGVPNIATAKCWYEPL